MLTTENIDEHFRRQLQQEESDHEDLVMALGSFLSPTGVLLLLKQLACLWMPREHSLVVWVVPSGEVVDGLRTRPRCLDEYT